MPKKQYRPQKKGKGGTAHTMTDRQLKQCSTWQTAISFGRFMDAIKQGGHHEKHIEKSLVETMDEQLRKVHGKMFAGNQEHKTPATSLFDEHFNAEGAIQDLIALELPKIARWHEHAKEGDKFKTKANMGKTIGTAFRYNDGIMQEYNADTLTVVLKKSSENKYGLELTTAFPSIDKDHPRPTGNSLTTLVEKTDLYNTLSKNPKTKTKADILLSVSGPNKNPIDWQYNELGGNESVHMQKTGEDGLTRHIHIDCQDLSKSCFYVTDGEDIVPIKDTGIFKRKPRNADATRMSYRKAFSQNYLDMYKDCPDECRLADRMQTYLFPEQMQEINQQFKERMDKAMAKKQGLDMPTPKPPEPQVEPVEPDGPEDNVEIPSY